ncbi:MAG: hypothetical protein WCI77_07870 [Candidatus Omnitrophota bacterium]
MRGKIRLRKTVVETWVKGAGPDMNITRLAEEEGIDPGNFSRMMSGDLEPSKPVMKKLLMRTGYSFDALFEFDRNATSDENDKTNDN